MTTTEHYFVLTNARSAGVRAELIPRLEATHDEFARWQKPLGSSRTQSSTEPLPSIVRLFGNRDEYLSYGGPAETNGYWSRAEEELVLCIDSRRTQTPWRTLQGLTFKECLKGWSWTPQPSPWFIEGNAECFAGYELDSTGPRHPPVCDHVTTFRSLVSTGKFIPLRSLVELDPEEFRRDQPRTSAEAWGLVYFLQWSGGHLPGWRKEWSEILPDYLRVWAVSGDAKRANGEAVRAVDWESLEASCRQFIVGLDCP
jgi:hypothetical protein